MKRYPVLCCLKINLVILLSVFIFCGVPIIEARAVSKFGIELKEKKTPVFFEPSDIWFYDQTMSKIIPGIDVKWIVAVFNANLFTYAFDSGDKSGIENLVLENAKAIDAQYDEIIDTFYDHNLAEDACFFRLRDDVEESALPDLIARLNTHEAISYTHPTLKIKDKTYAFFNAFEMEWKTGVDEVVKENTIKQAGVFFDNKENIYRVNVLEIPFFKALNLLAEDIRIIKVTPYLVEIKPSISAQVTLGIEGGNIGDKIPFAVKIDFSELIRIDPSSIANINLRPSDIQKELFELKLDPFDYVEAASKSPILITGWMRFYTPGEFIIPPISIKYTCSTCSDDQVRAIATNNLSFKVSSIVPSLPEENKLIIPNDYISPNYKVEFYHGKAIANLLVSLLSFLIGLGFIGWFIMKVHAIKKQKGRLLEKTREEILAEELRLFLHQEPSSPHWMYLGEVSKLVREYLVAKYGIAHFPAGGSGEVFFEAVRTTLPENLAPIIHSLFKKIDDLVALETHPYPDMQKFKSEVLQIINAP